MQQSDLNFDKVQFANRRAFPVHAEYGADHEWSSGGIDFSDYARMQTSVRAVAPCRQMETPSWAVNDAQLRELLVAFLEERAFTQKAGLQTGTLAERLANAQKKIIDGSKKHLVPIIDRLCNRLVALKRSTPLTQDIQQQIRLLEQQIENCDTRLRFEAKDGGAALVIGVVFYYFRCGLDSVGTSKHLSIKPPHARQIVWRLRQTWAKLQRWAQDPSTRPAPKAPKPKPEPRPKRALQPKCPRQPKRPTVDIERGALLLAQGHSLTDAARQLGVTLDRLRFALTKAGLYKPRFQQCNIDTRRVAKLRARGKVWREIGAELGCKPMQAYYALHRSREQAFKLRRQETTERTKERHVSLLEKLANENGGKIPASEWLRSNGYGTSHKLLCKHPEWFAHLARAIGKRGPGAYNHITFGVGKAVKLYTMGMSVPQIALSFGYPLDHGNNRVRAALIAAGVYQPKMQNRAIGGAAVASDSFTVS